jgi:hypothetical protein
MPAYIIYRNGVQIAITLEDILMFDDEDVVPGETYLYEVAAYDLDTDEVISEFAEVEVTIPLLGSTEVPMVGFDDEQVYGGYLGGKLRGKVVACPGRKATIAKPC